MQGLGGPDEDRSGGFEPGGWAMPLFDNEAASFLYQVYERADAFLFGRRTYEIFAGYWGTFADPGSHPIAAALNTRPKYVASTTCRTAVGEHDRPLPCRRGRRRRAESQAGRGAAGARQRRSDPLAIDNQLIDEMTLFVCPVVVGQGTRLFPDTGPDVALELVESRSTPKGVTIQVYRPTGRPQYETATPDPNT